MAVVVVVGLGPAGPEYVTQQAMDALRSGAPVFMRTKHHPAASVVPDAISFDAVYDTADKIGDVYRAIVDQLVKLAEEHGRIVYAVPGSPVVAERTVELLRDERVDIEVCIGLSFLELAWSHVGDPLTENPSIIDGHLFELQAAGRPAPLLVTQCDTKSVLSDIKLAYEDQTPEKVIVLQRLGLPDENVETVAWEDLDRVVEPDYLTSLWIPLSNVQVMPELARLHQVARELRERCPWDHEQTHESLKRYAVEETYELVDAIDEGFEDGDQHLIEELGDVLFQVFAHSAIGEEEGRFNIADVANDVTNKLVQRHPHVYGDVVAETADDVKATWETNKMRVKGRTSVLEGIPQSLPALLLASQTLKKAKRTEIEVDSGAVDAAVEQAQAAESALREAVAEYVKTFQKLESSSDPQGSGTHQPN